jgi:sensor histidine kinase regulating citrate/malate metabolism
MTQNSERLDAILGSLTVGIIAVLPDGAIELLNAEASRILGISSGRSARCPLTPARFALGWAPALWSWT